LHIAQLGYILYLTITNNNNKYKNILKKILTLIKENDMKTANELYNEILASSSKYVTYGNDGVAVLKKDALKDISSMEDEMIGDGDWDECDKNGNLI